MAQLLSDDRIDVFEPLEQALNGLRQYPKPTEGNPPSTVTQREAAAFLHSVILYDHPAWVAQHPEGFTDGLCVYLSADHVDALVRETRPSQAASNLEHVLAMAFDDLVNQHAFPDRPAVGLTRVDRDEVLNLLRQVDLHTGQTPEEALSIDLDETAGPLLRRFYGSTAMTSWDVGPLVEGLPSTSHNFESLHPVNVLHTVARMNTLGDQVVNAFAARQADTPTAVPASQVQTAIDTWVDAMVRQDLDPLRPSIFRLGRRLANLEQDDSSLFARNHVAQSAGKNRGFTDDYKNVMINGLAGYSKAPGLDPTQQPRTFKDLDFHLLAKTPDDTTALAAVAASLSGNPMAVAVAAANGRTVSPVLERTIGAAGTPEQQDWRDRYVYALPHAWVNFAGDALHSSRSGQENARRWRHATEKLSPEQAKLALQGVKLLSLGDANAWHDVWSVHREAAVAPTRAPSTPAGPGTR